MMHAPPTFARLVAWSVLLFGLSMGCGQGCGDPVVNPPAAREMPDADRSTVVVSRTQGVRANGEDAVDIQVTVLKEDGTPLSGRTVQVTVSGEGNTVAQPAGPTDAQGLATAKLVSTAVGVKTVTASVEAEGGPVTLSSRPTVEFIRLPASKLAFTAAPSSGTAGVGLGTFEVAIQNADGDTMTEATDTVTVAIGSGPAAATLKGTLSVAAVNGVARFDGLVLEKAARGYTLVASAGSLTGASSTSFDVASAAPAQLVLSHSGLPVTAGVPESVEVFARDAFGNDAAGYTGTVRFSFADGSATLPGDYTFTGEDQGRHVFTGGITARLAGAQRLTVTDVAEAAFTSSLELNVVPGPVKKLVFAGVLANRSVRASFDAQVALTDEFGNRVSAGAPSVTLSANKAVTGLGTVAPVDGIATFTGLSSAEEDTGYVLTASAPGVSPASSNAFTIIDDVPPSRPVLAQTGNTPSSVTVSWEPVGDDGQLGTPSSYELRYSLSDIVSDLDFQNATPVSVAVPTPSDTTRVVTIPGLSSNTTYYVALRVADNQGNAARSLTLAASTKHLTATQLAFTSQPQNGQAGAALAPITVEIRDAAGVRVDNASLAVTLTVQGTTGFGPFTVTSAGGVATFSNVRIDTAGQGYTLRATSISLTPADSQPFDIANAPASRLELAGLGPTVLAGADNTVTVTVRDAFGNLAENYTGTVSFTSSDTAAGTPSPYTFLATDKGQHTFGQVVLRTVGPQTLTVSAPSLAPATQSTTVGHADPSRLLLTGLPAEVLAGSSSQVSVEVLDGFGNRATGYTGTVVFSSTDSRATLPGEYTFTAGDQGFKQFPVTMVTAGARSVSVEDKATPATLNAKADTTVKWAPAVSLVLEAPGSVVAGNPLSMKVTATDAHGNTVEDYTQTVSFSADTDRVTLPAAYTFALSDLGSRRFDFTLEKAVPTKLTVTDGTLTATHSVSVSAAPASSLVLVAPAGPFQAGVSFNVDVTLKDVYGNVDTSYTGTVGFSSSDPQLVPPADGVFTSAEAGHRIFSVTLKTAGVQSLSVKDLARTFLTDTASSLQVDPGPVRKLVFRDQPVGGKVRAKLAPVTVAVTDDFGNTLDVNTPDITLALAGGNLSAVLGGGSPAVTPVNGLATFANLTVDQQGSGFRLDAVGGTLSGASTSFDIVDDVAPGAVPLDLVGKTSAQVELHWVAVGDDGMDGLASSYELLYATSPVDSAPPGTVTSVALGQPQAPALDESVIVAGLSPNTLYYFQLKVRDDAGNTATATLSTATNADPCAGYVCPVPAPTCAPDGVSQVTYSETCVDVANNPTCQQSEMTTACPGANAVCFNGACGTAASPDANQLSISEVMHSPSSSSVTEYIELTNNTGDLLNLNGLTVLYMNSASLVSSFVVGSGSSVPLVVDRNGTFVLAQNKDTATNGGVSANYQYGGGFDLEGSGQVILQSQSGITVEHFQYTPSFPQTSGRAMNLSAFVVGTRATAQPWYWCDSDSPIQAGGDLGTPNARNSTCGIPETPAVEWCNLQYPKSFPSGDGIYPATIAAGSSWDIYSRAYSPGVTTRNTVGNDYYPHLFTELGYGTDPADPSGWTWTPASPNAGYFSAFSNDDEAMASLSIPSPGTYHYGFRYRIWNPATSSYSSYVYCDQNGVATPPVGTYGTVTVTTSTPPPLTDHVVISEFSGGNGSGGAATDEFIELYNPTNSPVNLDGWTVQYKSASGTSYSGSVTINATTAPGGTIIQPKGYFLLGGATYNGSVSADCNYAFDTSASTTGGGHVRIGPNLIGTNVNDPNTVDKLGYGTGNSPEGTAAPSHPATGGSLERKAYGTSTSATMAVGGVDASHGNGTDTNSNANDFVPRSVRQPQNSLSPTESP